MGSGEERFGSGKCSGKARMCSGEAERKLATLRERLLKLSDTDIGIDMNTGDAIAEIKLVQTELNHLARKLQLFGRLLGFPSAGVCDQLGLNNFIFLRHFVSLLS